MINQAQKGNLQTQVQVHLQVVLPATNRNRKEGINRAHLMVALLLKRIRRNGRSRNIEKIDTIVRVKVYIQKLSKSRYYSKIKEK